MLILEPKFLGWRTGKRQQLGRTHHSIQNSCSTKTLKDVIILLGKDTFNWLKSMMERKWTFFSLQLAKTKTKPKQTKTTLWSSKYGEKTNFSSISYSLLHSCLVPANVRKIALAFLMTEGWAICTCCWISDVNRRLLWKTMNLLNSFWSLWCNSFLKGFSPV